MIKKILFSCFMLVGCGLSGVAQYDFSLRDASGATFYYQLLDQCQCVRVTHPQVSWPYYADSKPAGRIFVPEEVEWEGRKYKVIEVGDNAFYGCDGITSVELGGVQRIGSQAFHGCTAMDSVLFDTQLRAVGDGAFANCRALRTVDLPAGLLTIGTSAFSMCTGLERVVMSPETEAATNVTTFHGVEWMKEAKNRKIGPDGRVKYSLDAALMKKISD